MQPMDDKTLYRMLQLPGPDDILEEAEGILARISPKFDVGPAARAFETVSSLFNGAYPGYQACNTGYHDLRHTLETFLAMTRIIHGAVLGGRRLSHSRISLGLIAALLHDVGYIQAENDREGTGAKYTSTHVRRSADFIGAQAAAFGLTRSQAGRVRSMILCTDLDADIAKTPFPDPSAAFLGRMLFMADLLAQMSDRVYLEKLFLLFEEFDEEHPKTYKNAAELIRKTIDFTGGLRRRNIRLFDAAEKCLTRHFEDRWGVSENLYALAIDKHMAYLREIVHCTDAQLLKKLRRNVDEQGGRHAN